MAHDSEYFRSLRRFLYDLEGDDAQRKVPRKPNGELLYPRRERLIRMSLAWQKRYGRAV